MDRFLAHYSRGSSAAQTPSAGPAAESGQALFHGGTGMGSACGSRGQRVERADGAVLQPDLELIGRHRLRKVVALEFIPSVGFCQRTRLSMSTHIGVRLHGGVQGSRVAIRKLRFRKNESPTARARPSARIQLVPAAGLEPATP
jgi:hypothetical protein